jgi:hypothetical protein
MWKNSIRHVETIIKEDWTKHMGNTSLENVPPIIIELGQSDTESSDSEHDSES